MRLWSPDSACAGLPSAERERGTGWEVVFCAAGMLLILFRHICFRLPTGPSRRVFLQQLAHLISRLEHKVS